MNYLFSMILILSITLFAAIVPVDRAQKVAENYYKNYAPVSVKGNVVQKILTKEYLGQPTWYVVQFTEGFVLVAAEDNVRPILGYSFDGKIDEDLYNMNNPFVSKFSNYDRQIVHTVRENGYVDLNSQKEWKDIENNIFQKPSSSKAIVGPLLETTWHQNYPFNDQCPAGTPVGCVATAMAQIMRFHIGPVTAFGSNSYTDSSGDTQGSHSVDFSAQTYDWVLMLTTNGSTGSQSEVDELAKLSYHLGVSVNMDYNTDGSGAFMDDCLSAYQNNWGFGEATSQYMGTVTDSSVYSSTIMAELDNNRPMQFAGSSASSGGHSYVVDGFNVDAALGVYQYHFNWGWGGSYDGWYQLNDLTPGVSDFTENQEFIYGITLYGPSFYYYADFTTTAVINDSVTLEWEWVCDNENVVLSHYELFRSNELIAVLPDSTTSYLDTNLEAGEHTYKIVSYFGSESNPTAFNWAHWSESYFTAEVIEDPLYPVPLALSATSYQYNRQKIDLAWTKQFIGTKYFEDDFETGNSHGDIPLGWWQKGAESSMPSYWYDVDPENHLGWIAVSSYYPQWVFHGDYSCGANGDGEEFQYQFIITEDDFILTGSAIELDFYHFLFDGTEQGVFLFSGSQGGSPDGNITILKEYATGNQIWEHELIDLSAYTGTYRLGFYKKSIDGGGLFCFDNVIVGNDTYPVGDQPTGYEIYRNGSLETTVSCTGLNDTYEGNDFDDGWNEYFVKALYAGGNKSIGSGHASVWIDANPVPNLLEGSYDSVNDEVDLSWYAPGHYPIHWFGYEWESDSWEYLAYLKVGTGEIQKARTYYSAQDFDMGYNIHLEKVSAAFYEEVGVEDWSSNQFRYIIGTGTEGSEVVLHTSTWLTAIEDGSLVDYTFLTSLTITEDWYVEVELGSPVDGTPTILTNKHEVGVDTDQWNSVFYWTGDGVDNNPGWYAFSYGSPYEYEDYSILCYGYNDEPVITKGSNLASREMVEFTSIKAKNRIENIALFSKSIPKREKRAPYLTNYSSKALESYNVYRDEMFLANTTNKFYSDVTPLGIANYYVTTVYTDPVGESAPSNIIVAGSTGIEENNLPFETKLEQNYPNPFNPSTAISFSIKADNNVKLKIYNSSGQLVSTLINKFMKQGAYKATLDASSLSGGVYLYTLEVDGAKYSKKMTLVK